MLKFAAGLDERPRDPLLFKTLAWDFAVNLDVAYLFTDDELSIRVQPHTRGCDYINFSQCDYAQHQKDFHRYAQMARLADAGSPVVV